MNRDDESRKKRALRAARAVTLGVGMALVGVGCGTSHTGEDGSVPDAMGDSSADAVADSSSDAEDTGIMCGADWPDSEACCEMWGGFWDESGGCAVPGPFVPPAANV